MPAVVAEQHKAPVDVWRGSAWPSHDLHIGPFLVIQAAPQILPLRVGEVHFVNLVFGE